MKYVVCYIIFINIVGFFIMGIDKQKAKKGKWRIQEKTLFAIALLFGSFGVGLGMKHYRHKTKHKSFVIGIPLIEIVQVAIALVVLIKLLGA